jgi:phosphatidylserine/phosphatidylglycerophosphate/cardiolipin synthase-like enzyme
VLAGCTGPTAQPKPKPSAPTPAAPGPAATAPSATGPASTAPAKPGAVATAPSQPPALVCGGSSGRSCQLSLVATEPDDGIGALTERLGQAKASIDYAPFLLDEPTIVKALIDARRRGVAVRVLTEPSHDKDNAKAIKALSAAGVELREANPAFSLTHSKYIVLDGTRLLELTFNSTAKELPTNRDFALQDDDPNDVSFVQGLFNADWNRQKLGAIPPGFAVSPDNADETLPVLIRSARQSVDIYAEKLESSPLMDAIVDAARRGVDVRILADAPNHGKVPGQLQSLIRKGQVQVKIPRDLGVHAKVMVVDGTTVYLGSENVENAVGDQRRELGLIFDDPAISAHLHEVFERDWASPSDSLG